MNIRALLPRAPSYLNSRLLGYVTIGYIEPRTHYLGNWSPRVKCRHMVSARDGQCHVLKKLLAVPPPMLRPRLHSVAGRSRAPPTQT